MNSTLPYFLFIILILMSCTRRYERREYKHWIDEDFDCQNTRAEILIQSSMGPVKFKRVSGYYPKEIANKGRGAVKYPTGQSVKRPCNITFGEWKDPYSGKIFNKASFIQIDHIIPLKHAHDHGASKWSLNLKRRFANDFENLLAVEGKLNQKKSAKSPDKWMPPNKSYHCTYLRKWKKIKIKYELSSSYREKNFIKKTMKKCLKR